MNLISVFCNPELAHFLDDDDQSFGTESAAKCCLDQTEIDLIDRLINDKGKMPPQRRVLGTYLIKIARLGGYLARKNDPPPGNIVMWRGLSRLTDIALGAALGAKKCG